MTYKERYIQRELEDNSLNVIFNCSIINNDFFLFDYILKQNINVNYKNKYNNTALCIACDKNNLQMVQKLLKVPNIDINKSGAFNNTPLYIACFNRNIDIIKTLLDHPNININIGIEKDSGIYSILWLVCIDYWFFSNNYPDFFIILNLLLSKNPNLDFGDDHDQHFIACLLNSSIVDPANFIFHNDIKKILLILTDYISKNKELPCYNINKLGIKKWLEIAYPNLKNKFLFGENELFDDGWGMRPQIVLYDMYKHVILSVHKKRRKMFIGIILCIIKLKKIR